MAKSYAITSVLAIEFEVKLTGFYIERSVVLLIVD